MGGVKPPLDLYDPNTPLGGLSAKFLHEGENGGVGERPFHHASEDATLRGYSAPALPYVLAPSQPLAETVLVHALLTGGD